MPEPATPAPSPNYHHHGAGRNTGVLTIRPRYPIKATGTLEMIGLTKASWQSFHPINSWRAGLSIVIILLVVIIVRVIVPGAGG
jgi:hypothetical protein